MLLIIVAALFVSGGVSLPGNLVSAVVDPVTFCPAVNQPFLNYAVCRVRVVSGNTPLQSGFAQLSISGGSFSGPFAAIQSATGPNCTSFVSLGANAGTAITFDTSSASQINIDWDSATATPAPINTDFIQILIAGNGSQSANGFVTGSVNSQVTFQTTFCCGCCDPTCPCNTIRAPESVTEPFCNYQQWLQTGGYACSSCSIRLVKFWSYCDPRNTELKYGARWEAVNGYGVAFPLGDANFTVTNSTSCDTTACGQVPSCFPIGK